LTGRLGLTISALATEEIIDTALTSRSDSLPSDFHIRHKETSPKLANAPTPARMTRARQQAFLSSLGAASRRDGLAMSDFGLVQ
jgi:hypothetical protein